MTRRLLTLAIALATALTPAIATDLDALEADYLYNKTFADAAPSRVSVHDPSVVIGYEATDGTVGPTETSGSKKVYCVFGSHRAWAKSYDLQDWTSFTNNISTDYATIFATDAAYSAHGSSSYDVSGNLWAPDVIYNKDMGKWCMYMSVNGDGFYSSIVLLTAESLTGDWTRVGTVVYSLGKSSTYASETDVYTVLGSGADLGRYYWYRNSVNNHTYGTNAIDPCVFYDEDGNLWMSYGSWFGGLYLLRLDAQTGLRDYTYTYETSYELADGATAGKMNVNWCTSDAYQGIKIAGGNHCSGEASYIEYHDGYYWLFLTYGGLTATGGYNMRVFKSKTVTGPYSDISGDAALYSLTGENGSKNAGQINRSVGTRLMSYYRWGFMDYGYCAQGHNSAVVDDDGRMYLVYHTRFDDGTEGHQVRVHQLFTSSDGRVCAAPFEYRGEKLRHSAYPESDIVGYYGIIRHGNGTDYANLVCAQEEIVQLKADGTVSGAYNGSWSQSASSPEITITIKAGSYNETYTGYFLTQNLEETNYETTCFTAVDGSDKSLWGYRRGSEESTYDDELTVAIASKQVESAIKTDGVLFGSKITLPATIGGVKATYKSATPDIITDDGQVTTDPSASTSAYLEVTLTQGDISLTKTIEINLWGKTIAEVQSLTPDAILGHYADGLPTDTWVNVTKRTGISLSFMIQSVESDWDVIAKSDDDKYHLLLSVLHYDGTDYYEASATASDYAKNAMKLRNIAAWQLFLDGAPHYVTVSYNPDGTIGYYMDGVLVLTYDDNCAAGYVASGTTAQKPSDIVEAVLNYYLDGALSFTADVSDVVVGYAVDYSPVKLVSTIPLAEEDLLESYFSNITYSYDEPAVGVTDGTGLSLSFLVSGIGSDWDVIAKSDDDKFKLHLAVVDYDGSSFYEGDATVSEDASSVATFPYQLFLDATCYVTISYNPDGSIVYYRNGKRMLTFAADATASNGGSATPADVVRAVIDYYNAGQLSFTHSVTSLVIGKAVNEDSETGVEEVSARPEVSIRAEGADVVVSGCSSAAVYDMTGRLRHRGTAGRITGLMPGVYAVCAGAVVKLITVK